MSEHSGNDTPVVDQTAVNARIAQRLGIPLDTVNDVIDVEIEYQVGVGICEDPDWTFRFWDPAELAGLEPVIDDVALANDAARFLGVEVSRALAIYATELDELIDAGVAVTADDDYDVAFDDDLDD